MFRTLFAVVTAAAVLAGLSMPAWAQAKKELDNPAIVVVDMPRVLAESAAAKTLREAVAAKKKEFDGSLAGRVEALNKAREQLASQQAILAPEAFAQRRGDLEQQAAGLRREQSAMRAQLNNGLNRGLQRIQAEIAKVLTTLMQERGAQISLSRAAVLVFDNQLDVTDTVIKRLNDQLRSVPVDFAPANKS